MSFAVKSMGSADRIESLVLRYRDTFCSQDLGETLAPVGLLRGPNWQGQEEITCDQKEPLLVPHPEDEPEMGDPCWEGMVSGHIYIYIF